MLCRLSQSANAKEPILTTPAGMSIFLIFEFVNAPLSMAINDDGRMISVNCMPKKAFCGKTSASKVDELPRIAFFDE